MRDEPADPTHSEANSAPGPRGRRGRFTTLGRLAVLAAIFALPAAGAVLNFVGVYIDDTPAVPDGLDGAAGVALSPDGRHAYAVGSEDDALVVFVRDATAETLTFSEVLFDGVAGVFGLDGASGVAVSPDGRHVYTTGEIDDALTVFARDASSDSLTWVADYVHGVGGVFGLNGASSVIVSPDGSHVYTTAAVSNAAALFLRDASLDTLAFADVVIDGSNGADGLAGARSAFYSTAINLLFVASPDEDAVAVLIPDFQDGELQYFSHIRDGVGTIDGLAGASDVLVTPDGPYVYIAGRDEDAVAVFDVDGTFHLPNQLLQVARNGQNGVTGLVAPTALALSDDGRFLYVGTGGAGGLVVFRRGTDGRLTFLRSQVDTGGVLLQGAESLAPSPDGKHLLAASRGDDAVVMFRQDGIFSDGFESGDTSQWSNSLP